LEVESVMRRRKTVGWSVAGKNGLVEMLSGEKVLHGLDRRPSLSRDFFRALRHVPDLVEILSPVPTLNGSVEDHQGYCFSFSLHGLHISSCRLRRLRYVYHI
jgi:hypothetical protein